MANLVDATGTVSYEYNGQTWTFGALTRTDLAENYVHDEAGRIVSYTEYTFTINTYVSSATDPYAGESVADKLATMENILSHQGGIFRFSGYGLTLTANTGTSDRDVRFGPEPISLNYIHLGGGTVLVTWVVKVNLVSCTGAKPFNSSVLLERNFTVEYSVDEDNYVTRTVTGYVKIANNRKSDESTNIIKNPDSNEVREFWAFPVPLGFKRNHAQRVISADRTRLDYIIVDQEIPVSYQIGVRTCTATYSVKTDPKLMTRGMAILTARYTMAAGYSKKDAYVRFGLLVDSLVGPAKRAKKKGTFILPYQFGLQNNLFGVDVSFTFSFLIQSTSFNGLLDASGWLNEIQGTDFAEWQKSIGNQNSNAQLLGRSRMTFSSDGDQVTDACTAAIRDQKFDLQQRVLEGTSQKIQLKQDNPNKGLYIAYDSHIEYERESGVITHKLLRDGTIAGNDEATQDRYGRYIYGVTVTGTAIRIGQPVPTQTLKIAQLNPKVSKALDAVNTALSAIPGFGSQTISTNRTAPPTVLKLQNASFIPKILGKDSEDNIRYAASWRYEYILVGDPDNVVAPENPLTVVQASDGKIVKDATGIPLQQSKVTF